MGRLITGENDLETWCRVNNRKDLLEEWDYESNSDMKNKFGIDISKPSLVLPNSNAKVNWICKNGHHYKSSIGNRTVNKHGCPVCSGRQLLKGFNDFETWCKENNRQDLLDEWNYKRNGGIKPSEILYGGSGKKYWWIGSCGHEWDSVISTRVRERQGKTQIVKAAGCPYCSNPPKRIMVGFNDLETWCKSNQRAELLSEWDYEKNEIMPTEVSFGSGKSVWWKCNKNHSWKTGINNRTTGTKTNCPICARTQTSFPEQAVAYYLMKEYEVLQRYRINKREVDIYLPEFSIAIEYDGMLWHKGNKQEKLDADKSSIITKNCFLIRLRESAQEKTELQLDGRLYIIEFIAKNGKYITPSFEWALTEMFNAISNQVGKKNVPSIDMARDEYSIRAHYMNTLRQNSVAEVFPELVKEWDIEKNEGLSADAFSARNRKKVWWKCSNGHSWLASINTRTVHKLGCPYCAGQRIIEGRNDFKTWCEHNNPQMLSEWDYSKNTKRPEEIAKTYKEKMWWVCSKGHSWEATVYNRVNGTGCPICNTGNNVARNKISLAQWCLNNGSTLSDEWDYEKNDYSPEDVSYGSHKKAWWKCSKGHSWEAQIKSRTYNHGCPFCSGTNKKAVLGVNDLKSWCEKNDKTYILDEWDYDKNGEMRPDLVTFGSHKRIAWKCSKGHSWEAVIKERTKIRGNMCPICRKNP